MPMSDFAFQGKMKAKIAQITSTMNVRFLVLFQCRSFLAASCSDMLPTPRCGSLLHTLFRLNFRH